MPDRTSELADDYAEMQGLYKDKVEGRWYLIERRSGRRWIEEIQFIEVEEFLKFHARNSDTVTAITIHRKS